MAKKGGDVFYPTWEALRAEDREDEPTIVLTRDRRGRGTSCGGSTGPREGGLRARSRGTSASPRPNPTQLKEREESPWYPGPRGPMVAPGAYSVSLAKKVDGVVTPLGEAAVVPGRPSRRGHTRRGRPGRGSRVLQADGGRPEGRARGRRGCEGGEGARRPPREGVPRHAGRRDGAPRGGTPPEAGPRGPRRRPERRLHPRESERAGPSGPRRPGAERRLRPLVDDDGADGDAGEGGRVGRRGDRARPSRRSGPSRRTCRRSRRRPRRSGRPGRRGGSRS